jgi:phenylacetate-CoA ligase
MRSFADLCRERHIDGKDLGLKLVISTGELLTESARSHLREFFGCRVVDEYGCTESGILAFECEFGTMHTIPVAAYAEILSREEGDCQMDLEGEVVVSDLFGELLPLLKYRLHDRGHVSDASCRCGRELPALSIKSGRIDSFIETPRGKIYDAILAYTVPREVQRFKVYQTDENHLRAHIVTRPQWGDHDIATKCKLIWEEVIGPEMVVSVEVVDDIPLEDSGKLRYFVPLRGG